MTLYRLTASEQGRVILSSSSPEWPEMVERVRIFAQRYPKATIAVTNTEHDCPINDGLTSEQRAEVAEAVRRARSN